MTLLQKFSISALAVLTVFGFALGSLVTRSLERHALVRAQGFTAEVVAQEVRNELSLAELWEPKTRAQDYEALASQLSRLALGPNVFKVKVWNLDSAVVWAEERELVGQRFPENQELEEAREGRVAAELSRLGKAENAFERGHETLLELYVPIRREPGGPVVGVFEVYQDVSPLYEDVAREQRTVWASTAGGAGLLFGALFGIVAGASRQMRRQGEEIARSEARYRTLLHSARDGIVSVDGAGRIVLANRAAQQMLGADEGALAGSPFGGHVAPKDRSRLEAALAGLFTAGESASGIAVEIEGRRRDGTNFPLELSIASCGASKPSMAIATLRDLTESRALQQQLVELEKQSAVAVVAGCIGHELNNATTALLGYAAMLGDDPGNSKLARRCADVFLDQGERLELFAGNLLELGRPREPRFGPFDLNEFLEKVTRVLEESGVLKRLRVVREFDTELPPVRGDESLLEQVVRNLQINASHAMGEGGTLTLRTARNGAGTVHFTVTDTGCGIPDSDVARIFEPFFTTKDPGQGTGLGLHITRQIVEQHRGRLHLESQVGRGTSVTVILPAAVGAAEPACGPAPVLDV